MILEAPLVVITDLFRCLKPNVAYLAFKGLLWITLSTLALQSQKSLWIARSCLWSQNQSIFIPQIRNFRFLKPSSRNLVSQSRETHRSLSMAPSAPRSSLPHNS